MANLARASEAKSEYLRTSTWLAELELEDAMRSNKQLRFTLEREGDMMKPGERVLLQTRVIQSDIKLAAKKKVAQNKQRQLDELKMVK
jgi:hypothetical protein